MSAFGNILNNPLFEDKQDEYVANSDFALDLSLAEFEFSEAMEGMTQFMHSADAQFKAFEQIELFGDIIEEHGISKSLVMLMDPQGELAATNPEVPAFESLDEVPGKGPEAEVYLKGVKDTLKSWWETIKKWFMKMVDWVKNMFGKLVQLFQKRETILKKLDEQVSGKTLDSKKAKDKEFKLPSKKAMDNLIGKLKGLLDKAGKVSDMSKGDDEFFKNLSKDLAVVGLKWDASSKSLENKPYDFETTKKSFASHGYKQSDVEGLIDHGKNFCSLVAGMKDAAKSVENALKSTEKHGKSLEKSGAPSEVVKESKEAIKNAQKATNNTIKVTSGLSQRANAVVSHIISIARAYVACC